MHPILERFQKDVASHQIEVLHDDGLYRHLRFSNNGSSVYHFNITTWPGYLCISGDMGCFTFSRTRDMFEFFRQERSDMGINPGYWAEKLQAGAGPAAQQMYMEWDGVAFQRAIAKEYKCWLESKGLPDTETTQNLKEEIRFEILDKSEFEEPACWAVAEFSSSDAPSLFEDFLTDLGRSCHRYTLHYLWCCWAIVWGIGEYDKMKEKQAA